MKTYHKLLTYYDPKKTNICIIFKPPPEKNGSITCDKTRKIKYLLKMSLLLVQLRALYNIYTHTFLRYQRQLEFLTLAFMMVELTTTEAARTLSEKRA